MTTKRVQEAFEAIKSEVTSDNCQFFNTRNIVGDEIYNMISNFYYTNILEMDINKSKDQGGR